MLRRRVRTPPIPCALPKKKLSEAPKSVDESHEIATETERAAEEEALRREAHFECAVLVWRVFLKGNPSYYQRYCGALPLCTVW